MLFSPVQLIGLGCFDDDGGGVQHIVGLRNLKERFSDVVGGAAGKGLTNVGGVGASGAIFGLFGAYFVIARRRQLDTREIVGLIIANLVISFAIPLIDWRAHLGGLVAGGVVAVVYMATEHLPPSQRRAVEVAGVVALFVVLAFLVHYRTGQLHGVVA